MTYNPGIPQAGDPPSQSQSQLLSNFTLLNTYFAINHIPLTSGSNSGLHTKINFSGNLGADPNLSAPSSSLYPKSSGGNPQLFYQNGSSSSNVVQLTGLPVTTVGTTYGFTTPWGWIVNSGSINSGTATVTLPVSFLSATPTIYTALISPKSNPGSASIFISAITQTTFTYTAAANSYFLIIGT